MGQQPAPHLDHQGRYRHLDALVQQFRCKLHFKRGDDAAGQHQVDDQIRQSLLEAAVQNPPAAEKSSQGHQKEQLALEGQQRVHIYHGYAPRL